MALFLAFKYRDQTLNARIQLFAGWVVFIQWWDQLIDFFLFKLVLQLHEYFIGQFLLTLIKHVVLRYFAEVVFLSLIRSVKWFNPGKSLDSNLSLAGSSILLAKLPGLMNAVRRMTGRDDRKKGENFEDFIKIAWVVEKVVYLSYRPVKLLFWFKCS